jgi:alpha/beta superfamily hydrolase
MVNRARFLHAAGYTVLLIDFQASGESPGKAVTFGYREANDVKASLRYLHQQLHP